MLASPGLVFNAARLDRSIAVVSEDYVRLAWERVCHIRLGGVRPSG